MITKMNEYKADLAKTIFGLETLDTQSNDSITKDIALIEKIQQTQLYNDFNFKQLRLKIMNIESASGTCCDELKHRLLNIVTEGLIDDIYCHFFDIDPDEKKAKKKAKKVSIAVKSYQIMKHAYKMFGIDEDKLDLSAQIGVYKTIWDIYYSKYDFSLDENTPNIIFYGSPGTGKTYTVNKYISQKSGNAKDKIVNVQCHPGFGYEEFIEGIKPLGITDSGAVKLGIVNGLFKDLCIEARKDMSSDYYFVADEINRANLSSMFGETLSKLEADYRDDPNDPEKRQVTKTPLSTTIETYINENILNKNAATAADLIEQINNIRKMAYECDVTYDYNNKPYTCSIYDLVIEDNKQVKVPYENGSDTVYGVISDKLKVKAVRNVTFGVPKNIRFIGMMNDVDKSIDSFDLALRRRFKWIKKRFDKSALIYSLSDKGVESGYIDEYVNACEKLNEYINKELGFGESYEFGHAYYMRIETSKDRSGDKVIIRPENCEALFANYLEPVLTEYIRSFKEETTIDELVNKAKEVFTEDIKSFIAPELLEDLMPGIDGDSLSSYCEACTMLNKFLTTRRTIIVGDKSFKGLELKKHTSKSFSIPILCEDFAEIKGIDIGNTITKENCEAFFEQNIKKKLDTYLKTLPSYKMTGDSNSSKNKEKERALIQALDNAKNVFTKAMPDSANADADDVNASKD